MPAPKKTSAESEILTALNANNPFERPPVVREQNIWGDSFPDIPSLNAKASDSLFDAMSQVRTAESSLKKVTSLVFLSDKGNGKSHVIKRIRRRLQASSEGIFIYASADRYGNLLMINSLFQQSFAESLDQPGSEGVTQWQEVAALMVANALKVSNPDAQPPSALELVRKFDQLYHAHHTQGTDLVGKLAKAIRRLNPDTDSYILRALIWTLSEERGSLAVKWLAGEQLDTQDAADLRLPPNQRSEGEADASALTTLSKLVSSISEYKTVVICFDELDTSAVDEDGRPPSYIILNLVKRLFNSVQQSESAKGVVLLTAIIPSTWRQAKQNFNISMDRISAYGEPISLTNLNEDTAIDLCALTLGRFYEKKGLTAPNPIYPFTQAEIIAYSKGRPSAREALKWFAAQLNEKSKTIKVSPPSYLERFELAYQNALERFELDDLDSNDVTASALRFCFQKIAEIERLRDRPIEGVMVKGVEDITPRARNNGRLNFKVIGEENGKPVVIGVGVMQETHGLTVGAGFRRLLDTKTFGLSRGCLVRSRDRKLKRYWEAFQSYQQLVTRGGEWVDLTIEGIKPLLALQYVYEHHEKFELTTRRIDSFGFTRKLLRSNQIIREILSRPEGNVAEEASEGEERQRLTDEIDMNELEADLLQSLEEENSEINESEVQVEMKELADALSA